MTDCKSFVLATFEGGGSVTPMLAVARQLVARGHRVRVMSDPCNRPESEATGARFVPWTTAPSKAGRGREFDHFHDWAGATPFDSVKITFDALLTGPALPFARDVMEELAREPADLVVACDMLFGVHLGCEATGQNAVLLGVNINLLPPAGVPPMGPGLMPAETPEAQAEQEALRAAIRTSLDGSGLPALNAARAALGLTPLSTLADQYAAARALLLATARAFDFAPDPQPEGLHYVGPILAEPHWAEPWTPPFPTDDTRPLVLTAFSTTFQNHAGVVQNVIDALAQLPVRGLVTLGGGLLPADITGASNVVIVESAPHGAVMADAAAVITHGGHGTVMKALAAGLPQLIIPHGRDQNDNAARIVARGAGLSLAPSAAVEDIRAALSRLVGEPSFSTAAEALGARVRAEAEQSPLIALLEQMARTPSRSGNRCAA